MAFTIEKYEKLNLDRMMSIWRAATVTAHEFMSEDELDRDDAMIRNGLIDQTETWIAWEGEQMAGFICLMGKIIVALFVDPARHREGIGSALIEHVNVLHGPLNVEVFTENTNGVAFYEKQGFARWKVEDNPYYPGHTHWLMAQDGAEQSERPG